MLYDLLKGRTWSKTWPREAWAEMPSMQSMQSEHAEHTEHAARACRAHGACRACRARKARRACLALSCSAQRATHPTEEPEALLKPREAPPQLHRRVWEPSLAAAAGLLCQSLFVSENVSDVSENPSPR